MNVTCQSFIMLYKALCNIYSYSYGLGGLIYIYMLVQVGPWSYLRLRLAFTSAGRNAMRRSQDFDVCHSSGVVADVRNVGIRLTNTSTCRILGPTPKSTQNVRD